MSWHHIPNAFPVNFPPVILAVPPPTANPLNPVAFDVIVPPVIVVFAGLIALSHLLR